MGPYPPACSGKWLGRESRESHRIRPGTAWPGAQTGTNRLRRGVAPSANGPRHAKQVTWKHQSLPSLPAHQHAPSTIHLHQGEVERGQPQFNSPTFPSPIVHSAADLCLVVIQYEEPALLAPLEPVLGVLEPPRRQDTDLCGSPVQVNNTLGLGAMLLVSPFQTI